MTTLAEVDANRRYRRLLREAVERGTIIRRNDRHVADRKAYEDWKRDNPEYA